MKYQVRIVLARLAPLGALASSPGPMYVVVFAL